MSISILLLITGTLFFLAVALTALILAARNADDGYEDETGYHAGRQSPNPIRAVRTSSAAIQPAKIMLMPDVPISALLLAPGANPKPPRMDPVLAETDRVGTPLVPVHIPFSALQVQPPEPAGPKRKRRAVARKDDPSDGNQLGFPGFAA